jgi:hypothetical protein
MIDILSLHLGTNKGYLAQSMAKKRPNQGSHRGEQGVIMVIALRKSGCPIQCEDGRVDSEWRHLVMRRNARYLYCFVTAFLCGLAVAWRYLRSVAISDVTLFLLCLHIYVKRPSFR